MRLGRFDARGSLRTRILPSGRRLALELRTRAENLVDAKLLIIGPACLQRLRLRGAIRCYGALLLSVGQVQAEQTRRGSR